MRKLLFVSIVALLSAITVTSCIKNDGEHAEAQVSYVGVLDSIKFTDNNDSAYFKLISEALCSEKLKVAGANSLFSEKATVDYGSVAFAVAICDSLANKDYIKLLQSVKLSDVKSTIFYAHSDSLRELGILSPELVPISPFTARLSLYSSHYSQAIHYYTRDFR